MVLMQVLMRVYTKSRVGEYKSAYVLAHDHMGIDVSEGFAHNADLFGCDVIAVHEDALLVLVHGGHEIVPDSILAGFLVNNGHS
jgi:hypothetical protein